ncbi:hypothetical protein XELAEV_18006889mg [Xenopus laevis]|uniref:Uncharacterized protein n=1 Tax=Xenopus laevis TaxID=8355 RepID=A0A974I469_XENLA|nr:hypothetical protein XELAEV_18006889mg [Xenopus laevis]
MGLPGKSRIQQSGRLARNSLSSYSKTEWVVFKREKSRHLEPITEQRGHCRGQRRTERGRGGGRERGHNDWTRSATVSLLLSPHDLHF